ncbi:MAG: hypothetical protein ACRD1B_10200 [Thermoanaerobaculia bacterium]
MKLLPLLLAALAAAPLCAQEPERPEANRPVTSPGNAVWAPTWDAARKRAGSENKFVFVEFDGGPECGQCHRMDSLLYPAFDFEALLIGMVPVKVVFDSPEGKELARRYPFDQPPAVLITTPEGRLIFLMQGFTNAPEFYRQATSDLTAYRKFARRVEAQDITRLPAAEALATGLELYQRFDPQAALPRLKRAVSAPDAKPAERDKAREQLAAVELELGQPAAARATIDALLKTTREPDLKERAEIFRAQLPLHEGKPAEALKLLQKFVADHPKSVHAGEVRQVIEQLTGAQKAS